MDTWPLTHRHFRSSAFTLVELLVVVAIIAVLIALLLPALGQARYNAKVIRCMSQMRQMCLGIFMYTHDYDGYYPDGPWGRPDPAQLGWIESQGFGTSGGGDYDLRPALRFYFGTQLNNIMKCPLATDWWWKKPYYSDLDKYNMGASAKSKTPYDFYFGRICVDTNGSPSNADKLWPRQTAMRRRGDYFIPGDVNLRFNLLMSDLTYANGYGGTYLLTTHQPYGNATAITDAGNYDLWNIGYRYPPGQTANTNYAQDDGSAKTYNLRLEFLYQGVFKGMRNQSSQTYIIPTEAQR